MNDLAFSPATDAASNEPVPRRIEIDGAGGESLPLVVQYLRVARRWKWLILGSFAVAAALALVVTFLTTPLYTAEATLEIQRERNSIVPVQGVQAETSSVDMEFYQTQYGLLQSRSLSERVATDLRLYLEPQFFEMYGDGQTAASIRENPGANSAQVRQERVQRAGAILLRNVNVAPVRLSRLVSVRFTSPDPQFAARILNAWTRDFVQAELERRYEATAYARRFLEQHLEELRARLEQSERQLVAYASRERIINIPSSTSSSATPGTSTVTERPLVAEDLSALNQQLNEATAARIAAESRLGGRGGSTPEAFQSQAISTLRERRAEMASERARMLTQFEPQYPPAQALSNQIQELDRAIAREEGRVGSMLQTGFVSAQERERALQTRVNSLQEDLLNLRGRTIQYNIYQRDVDTNRQLYDGLLQRYKEIGIAGGIGVNNVSIVDPGQIPSRPTSPSLIRNLLLAMLLGAVVGVGLAFALEQIDETVSNPSDVEQELGLPLLGTIPKSDSKDPKEDLADRKSGLVEAYLSAQTSLGFTTDHGIPKSFLVTSTQPAEGKSTTAFALAQSLARTGRSVVLVDADMRSPSLHHLFDVKNEQGLSNFLAGDDNLISMVRREWPDGPALLPAGPPPPNAAELLIGDRLDLAIRELTALYDHVIMDAPPVMGLADTPLIAARVEGTIFVVESHATRSSRALVAVRRLRDAHARILGVLMTKFESKRAHYGYGYDYGYGYGEGSDRS